jgi:hypothetical protein
MVRREDAVLLVLDYHRKYREMVLVELFKAFTKTAMTVSDYVGREEAAGETPEYLLGMIEDLYGDTLRSIEESRSGSTGNRKEGSTCHA